MATKMPGVSVRRRSWLGEVPRTRLLRLVLPAVLRGISRVADIGYLTQIEALKYCEVGSFLKSPRYPIWVLGSETHMTVLFSLNKQLACREESRVARARRVFSQVDSEGNGFVDPSKLPDLLRRLDMDTSQQNVTRLTSAMDTTGLGLILLTNFLETLFPGETESMTPKDFVVFHWNGMSNAGQYVRGVAKTVAPQDFGASPIMQCLRTKWSALQIQWETPQDPSIS
eukprot:m.66081 g.66081  ORF g.66081 m.66081 type:complete len:227 (-) comp7604_c0_seq1:50-730(-)